MTPDSHFVSKAQQYIHSVLDPTKALQLCTIGSKLVGEDRVRYFAALVKTVQAEDVMDVSPLREIALYKYQPVDIETFICDSYYLNKKAEIYPKVLEELIEINSGKYIEVVLTGGIGSAKTTGALYTTAYQLYLLSCLKNPHEAYGLDPSSELLVIFQSINGIISKASYKRFKSMIEMSPYFKEKFSFDKNMESRMIFPNRIEVVPISGAETAAIGQNVIGGLIDELNYMSIVEHSKASVDAGTYDQAVALYNSIARRRKSRFMSHGKMPGMLCLVSSKRYPGQFTDTKEVEAQTDPTIYIYDKRVWDVKPEGSFGHDRFQVFIGDESRKPRVLLDGEAVSPEDRKLVDNIPMEFKTDFEKDIINALREIAGRSTLSKHPYFTNLEAIAKSLGKVQSVFSREEVDFVERTLDVYPKRIFRPELPRFAHVDLSKTSDHTGIAIGTVTGFTRVNRSDIESEGSIYETLPLIHFDAVLEVSPPKSGEILFHKVRNIFYTLRQLGMNLKWITFDSFESTDSMQMLRQKGFLTGYCSMDISPTPYDMTKTAFYDGRVKLPTCHKLLVEMASLEKDPKTSKIDHPPRGSKDLSDAVAGVVYGLTMRREIWAYHKVSINDVPISITNQLKKEQNHKTTLTGKGE